MERCTKAFTAVIIFQVMVVLSSPSMTFAADLPMADLNFYQKDLTGFLSRTGKESLEPAFRKGMNTALKLTTVLESLSDPDYELVKKKMVGFRVNRDESVYIAPDNDFFYPLAEKRGLESDIVFFKFLKDYKPDGVWSAYVEPQTDYSGCVTYGTGLLTSLYKEANDLKSKYKTAYQEDVDQAIHELEQQFTESTCACGGADSATKEFALFLKEFPVSTISQAVQRRLLEIKAGKSNLRFNCHSG